MNIGIRSMRMALFILTGFLVSGCDRSPTPPVSTASAGWAKSIPASTQPSYVPERFRADVVAMIRANRYEDAVLYVGRVDPARQADHDRTGFLAVRGYAIGLPGGEPNTYDPKRDWCFPGTQDAIEHLGWQSAAEAFATEYNNRRLGGGG